jgi:hypothetical protein
LLERQHAEVREVIDEAEDSNVQVATVMPVMGETGEGASYTQNSDHLRVSYSLSGNYLAISDSENTTKVSFSAARRQHLRECFDEILDAAASQSGVHHKMAAAMEDVFVEIEKVGGNIGKHKKKRKNPRTWKDSTPNTVYLD